MHKALIAVLVLLVSVSCSSTSTPDTPGVQAKVRPEIEIAQISSVPAAARHVTGGVPVQYALRVGNRSAEPIRLVSVSLVSIGSGAYNVSGSSSFKTSIQPDQEETVEFWMPAYVSNPTIIGANGPVTLRATVHFEGPGGKFQEVVVRQVNAMPGRDVQ